MRESSALRPLFDAWRLLRPGLRRTIACGFIATLFVLVPTAHAATPVIGPPTITGTPGANGWYVSAVTVTYQVSVTSFTAVNCGVVQQFSSTGFTGVITLSGDGANQDAQCTVTERAYTGLVTALHQHRHDTAHDDGRHSRTRS